MRDRRKIHSLMRHRHGPRLESREVEELVDKATEADHLSKYGAKRLRIGRLNAVDHVLEHCTRSSNRCT